MRRPALLVSSVLLAAGLSACGGDDVAAYCDQVEQSADLLESSPTEAEDVEQFFSTFERLAEAAPEEISSEWQMLNESFQGLQQAIEDSGFTTQELADLGGNAQDVDPERLQTLQENIAEAEQEFSGPEFDQASERIDSFTQENCGVEPFSGS
ncbi:hypothetical protein KLP28_03325 [Nocardioidaceae bacterium]|nr:hypothetical protein KLP28_03325 [Nocardioidaceae bacterium]